MPYALASGFFAPHGVEATGLLRYLMLHGSRLLGLVRAGTYRLAGADASVSGTDQVYGINVSRFLADDDQPDQLALSLYGTLAAALTPRHVRRGRSGVGLAAARRALPDDVPAAEQRRRGSLPRDAPADARARGARAERSARAGSSSPSRRRERGSRDGKSIAVRDAPTSFGPVQLLDRATAEALCTSRSKRPRRLRHLASRYAFACRVGSSSPGSRPPGCNSRSTVGPERSISQDDEVSSSSPRRSPS